MLKKLMFMVTAIAALLLFSGCAGSSMMDTKITSKKARIIFDVPASVNVQQVKKALYSAVSVRISDIQEQENFFPEELADTPLSPKISNVLSGMASIAGSNPKFQMMQLDTSNAYYSIYGHTGMNSGFNAKAEYYKGAIYPYKNGYKVYLYLFYQEGTDGIMGSITKVAVDSIVGAEGALTYMAQERDEFLSQVKEAKILSQSPSELESIKLNSIGLVKTSSN